MKCKAAALATMMLMAGVKPAGSALPPAHDMPTPEAPGAPVVCMIDSAFGMDANTPRMCFTLMHDREMRERRAVGKGYLGLGFARAVPAPVSIADVAEILDIRDESLPVDRLWAMRVCWARMERTSTPPTPPCWD